MRTDHISCLFTDYDGTLSPLEVTIEDSRLAPSLEEVLKVISRQTKLAVVTSKPFEFIAERMPFAHAWGCTCGLDVRSACGGREVVSVSPEVDVERGLEEVRGLLGGSVTYEEKWGLTSLLGFSVDWRGRRAPQNISSTIEKLRSDGFHVVYDRESPFVDFFCSPPDKGRAVSQIARLLGVAGTTMYLGDSMTDNSAFLHVDVPIGVDHGQRLDALECEFVVGACDVVLFLKSLAEGQMAFAPDLPGIRRRRRR